MKQDFIKKLDCYIRYYPRQIKFDFNGDFIFRANNDNSNILLAVLEDLKKRCKRTLDIPEASDRSLDVISNENYIFLTFNSLKLYYINSSDTNRSVKVEKDKKTLKIFLTPCTFEIFYKCIQQLSLGQFDFGLSIYEEKINNSSPNIKVTEQNTMWFWAL